MTVHFQPTIGIGAGEDPKTGTITDISALFSDLTEITVTEGSTKKLLANFDDISLRRDLSLKEQKAAIEQAALKAKATIAWGKFKV